MDQIQPSVRERVELKCVKTIPMELCVMTSGTDLIVMLSVDNSTSCLVSFKL